MLAQVLPTRVVACLLILLASDFEMEWLAAPKAENWWLGGQASSWPMVNLLADDGRG